MKELFCHFTFNTKTIGEKFIGTKTEKRLLFKKQVYFRNIVINKTMEIKDVKTCREIQLERLEKTK